MFGMRHFGSHCEDRHAAGRHGRWGRHHRHGGGRHGRGGGFGRRRHDARRPHAGAGRPSPAGAGADRRAAAPRLRDHQGAGGEDRGLVRAEPRHRLSDADLSRRGRLRHRAGRRRQAALHHHRRRPRLSGRATARSSMRCWSGSTRSASGCARAAATRTTTAGAAARVPRLVRAALENLREVAADRLKGDADAEAKVVEVLARAAAELKKN